MKLDNIKQNKNQRERQKTNKKKKEKKRENKKNVALIISRQLVATKQRRILSSSSFSALSFSAY